MHMYVEELMRSKKPCYAYCGSRRTVLVSNKKVEDIFIQGHKCPKCYKEPKSRKEFWVPKIKKNVESDKEVNKKLKKDGWKVIRMWEHELK